MKQKKVLLFAITVLMFIFVIVISSKGDLKETKGTDVKSAGLEEQEQVNIKDGSIYYKELSVKYDIEEFYYNYGALYGYGLLYYNGRIYTSNSFNIHSCNSKPDAKLLSKVYGNFDICWSEDASMLASVTGGGDIYETRGYNEEDRICLCFKKRNPAGVQKPEEDIYYLQYFECLNGIYVSDGKDLYKDKLHLENTQKVYISKDITGKGKKEISVTDAGFNELLESLYENKFLQPDIIENLEDELEIAGGYVLELEDEHGIITVLSIYFNGYVIFESPERKCFIIKIDKDICNKIYTSVY